MPTPGPDLIERYRTPIGLALVALIISGSIVSLYSINAQNKTPEISLIKKEEQTNTSNVANDSFDVARIKVHVSGAVKTSGVYELNKESRVEDALNAAGGLSDAADDSYIEKNINLAEKLSDGDKIYIPAQGDTLSAGTPEKAPAVSGTADVKKTSVININTASIEDLVAANLYRIGYKTAEKIVEYREQKGSFSSIEEIMEVSGIGEKTFERAKDRISVE